MGGGNRLLDSHNFARFTPKFFFILGIIFNLSLLGFFKYTDFLLENFNAFSQIARLDFNIPLPHILLPLALSFVTFQQIAFLFDCYKHATGQSNENLHIDFIDYALFISFFPQLIAGPIVHHREMMPQFAKMGNSSLARPSRELEKFSFDRQPALSQSNFSAQPTNLTQDTRIANDSRESNNPSMRGSLSEAKTTKQSKESTNLICIFIAKNKILQMPFSALKESIFATLKRQINFRSDLHKNKRNFRKPSTNLKSTNSANHAHTKALQK